MNIFSLSFGKDSMATLILAAEQGIPIDRVLYVDIKFNDEISGEPCDEALEYYCNKRDDYITPSCCERCNGFEEEEQ